MDDSLPCPGADAPRRLWRTLGFMALLIAGDHQSRAAEPAQPLTRLVAHWAEYADPGYLPFIADAQPDVAQVGFYGGHFWSLGHTPQYSGYPAHFPVRGLDDLGAWFEDLTGKLHARGVKVVGHFNVEFLVGDPSGPEGPTGFFKFYRDLWNEKVLGPKPVADPVSLLEKNADGSPLVTRTYAIGGMNEHWACLRNPAWQVVLKAWVRQGIRRGVDGFMVNYFYRHNCLCGHCQRAFRHYLAQRFSTAELRNRFGITDLRTHHFSEIVSWHPIGQSTPLRREMLRFSQVSNKEVFDEVFVRYGRSLKPDLIVGQWNHLGNFVQIDGDERCLLPAELWGRGESYLWYSTGDAANSTDLKNHMLGEATLQARYVRGAFGGRPFTLGKYESTRIRVAIAELAANGGAPMGFYTSFTDPAARAEIVRYYQFLRRRDAIFRGNRSHAEVALLFPRRQVHDGQIAPVETFRKIGQALLDAHVLFDVWPDDSFPPDRAPRYARVLTIEDSESGALTKLPARRSRFEAPYSVRISASRPAGTNSEIDLHLVNYDRTELPPGPDSQPNRGVGIQDERPRAVSGITANVVVPPGMTVGSVRFLVPERGEEQTLEATVADGCVRFAVPEFLVYGIVRMAVQSRR
jgi:hypothetical protein